MTLWARTLRVVTQTVYFDREDQSPRRAALADDERERLRGAVSVEIDLARGEEKDSQHFALPSRVRLQQDALQMCAGGIGTDE